MMSVASPGSQVHSSRRRGGTNAKETTTEDQALNMIAREAEARLAAKRAARAEARSIRMKEIERKQKEADEDDVTSEDTEPAEDSMYVKRVGRMSSPTYDVLDTVVPSVQVTNDTQIIQLKETVKENEVKYKKAMVSAAQLDNERQALQYQVEVLKDIIEELQQKIENTDDELHHKTKEYNKLNREHKNTTSELNKCLFLLEERERVLDENGLNIDGTIKEGYSPQTSSAQCSLCSASLNENKEPVDDHRERGSLLAEIASLKSEIEDLKQTSNSELSRRELDSMKIERVELEQSFADVSNEAAVIREDALHTGLYINNNEKNEDFELIDDGSQQGGIRHFEDQSFEKSTSSLASSMLTEGLTSMESSVPLEISVDNITKPGTKDDYDIVQVEDSTKTANINVDSYTSLEFHPSTSSSSGGEPSSNININKYLFDDHDDTLNEDNEQYSGFSVDRYFAAESLNYNTGTNAGKEVEYYVAEENNELQTSVDTITNVQSDYDTIDTEDVLFNHDTQFALEENRNSPYEDVQVESVAMSRPSDGIVIIEESKTSDRISFDETSVESSDIRLLKAHTQLDSKTEDVTSVYQTDLDADLDMPTCVQSSFDYEKQNPIDISTQVVTEKNSSIQTGSLFYVSDSNNRESDLYSVYDDSVKSLHNSENQVDNCSQIKVAKIRTSIEADISETGGQASVSLSGDSANAASGSQDHAHPPLERVESISETDKIAIRKDFEELYNQIAGETNEPVSTYDEGNIRRTSSSGKSATGENGKKGWLVQVETFSVPEVIAPDIKIVDVNPEEIAPEPKERKKKKKKKKHDKTDEGNSTNAPEAPQDVVVPSDPLLLGFATESDGVHRHSQKSAERTSRPTSDIPKQFLDASAELIDNSFSDTSDIEDGEIGEDGKKKSSKRSKKEGCKSQ